MSLRTRLLALVLLAMSAPAMLVGLRFAQDRSGAVESARAELSARANAIAEDLDQKVQGTSQLLHGLARARDLDTRDRVACSAFLAAVLKEYPRYTGLLTIQPDGRLFCDSLQTGRELDLRDRDYFQSALARPGVALQPAFGRLTGTSVLQIAHAARRADGSVGFVLLASLNLQSFGARHVERLPAGAELLLVDRAGTLMVRAPGGDGTKPGEQIGGTELFRFAESLGDVGVGEARGLEGRLEVWGVAASPEIRDAGLRVLVGQSKSELVAAADRRFAQDMGILGIVSLLLFAGVWTLAELGVRRQVGRISAMAARLGQGDLGARIPPPHPRGELGELMAVLNGAGESLERQRAAIEDLDRRLRQSQKMEALGQLTGGMAHDFNNLLTVIMGNSEYLSEELAKDHPALRRFAELSLSAAERGAELTKSLLAFARRQPLEPKSVDVGRQMRGMETLLRRTLGEQIECSFALALETWPARVDPAQLESAILNLAINARDAMPRGGRLTIEVANARLDEGYSQRNDEVRAGDYVMVAVTDTGAGMTPEVAARAFEPFFTTKDVGKGSGLGLSMVYGFAKQSGGLAKIYSEPGHGTAVKLYLPRADAPAAGAERASAQEAEQGGGESILVVEDDGMVRAYVERELETLGYRVVMAADAQAALEILRGQERIDLLFTDIVMPGGMLGPQLAEEASRLRPGLKVVFTSGYSESGVARNGRAAAAAPLLSKPYRRHDLATMLRSALKS